MMLLVLLAVLHNVRFVSIMSVLVVRRVVVFVRMLIVVIVLL